MNFRCGHFSNLSDSEIDGGRASIRPFDLPGQHEFVCGEDQRSFQAPSGTGPAFLP